MSLRTLRIPHLGSLGTTLSLLGALGVVIVAGLLPADLATDGSTGAMRGVSGTGLTLVFAGLALNLVAALFQTPALTRRLPLLLFHLALLMLVALVGVGRLTALDGRFELTEGVVYEGQLIDARAGRWHRGALEKLVFRHEGFEIDYAPGLRRGPTRNKVSWLDENRQPRQAVIGDHRPLVLQGYRIYTSPNKGFAPVIGWTADLPAEPEGSPPRKRPLKPFKDIGAIHLPSYPANELRQSREWRLPDGRTLWVKLDLDDTAEPLIDPEQPSRFRLPGQHHLVVWLDEQRHVLAPGDNVRLPGGSLSYEGLRTWMGYRITYDPTLPWLLATALFAVWALAWHYLRKFVDHRQTMRPAPAAPARGGVNSASPGA
jgi:cytochrome c biogenesis protein